MHIPNTQITQIVKDIWVIMFSSAAELIEIENQANQFSITGSIQIKGAWNGKVLVHCSKDIISELSSQILGMKSNALTEHELADTMREVTNLIGGNIKPFLPSPSELSIADIYFEKNVGSAIPQNRVDMRVNNGLLRVELVAD